MVGTDKITLSARTEGCHSECPQKSISEWLLLIFIQPKLSSSNCGGYYFRLQGNYPNGYCSATVSKLFGFNWNDCWESSALVFNRCLPDNWYWNLLFFFLWMILSIHLCCVGWKTVSKYSKRFFNMVLHLSRALGGSLGGQQTKVTELKMTCDQFSSLTFRCEHAVTLRPAKAPKHWALWPFSAVRFNYLRRNLAGGLK